MLNHHFITKGAFFWEDPDLDLRSNVTHITVHERNGVSDELSENSKKCAILRLVYARGLLSSSLNGSSY